METEKCARESRQGDRLRGRLGPILEGHLEGILKSDGSFKVRHAGMALPPTATDSSRMRTRRGPTRVSDIPGMPEERTVLNARMRWTISR